MWIDFHALVVEKYFYIDKNLDTSGDCIDTAFLCYNGKPTWHREKLVKNLIELDLVESNFVTFSGSDNIDPLCIEETHQRIQGINEDPFDAMTLGDINYWNRHFLNVVTETVWDVEKDGFWSEKVFKPIIGKKPFLIYAPNGAVNFLHMHGFQDYTNEFSDITDLDLTDPNNIPKFLKILSSQGHLYYKKKYHDLEEKIKHNYHHFYNYVKNIKQKINNGYNNDNSGLIATLFDQSPKYDTKKISIQSFLPSTTFKDSQKDKTRIYSNIEFVDNKTKELCNQGNYFIVGSSLRNQSIKNVCFFSWHMHETQRVNKKYNINIPKQKPYLADILLGRGKPHRLDFFEKIRSNPHLFENCLINLHRQSREEEHHTYSSAALDNLEELQFLSIKQKPEWSSVTLLNATNHNHQGCSVFASQLVPEKIYKNSWITIPFETLWENDHFFPTEKIAKPIVAGRIFMVSSGKNYLASLRDLGFRTFDGIIDENYDTCDNYHERNSAILIELQRLNQLDMSEVYRSALPVLEHNQNLIYSDFQKEPARKFLLEILKNHS